MTAAALSPAEGEALVRLARAAIEERLFGGGALARARGAIPSTPRLLAPGAAFVTIKTRAESGGPRALRGCIGTLEPRDPLGDAVVRCACDAAFADPRFTPLTPGEWTGVEVSVTVLGPSRAIDAPSSIVAGRHGVVLERGVHRAVFLPQVASEQGWDVPTLLEHLALKAGLPRDGWREARLAVFEADVFGAT